MNKGITVRETVNGKDSNNWCFLCRSKDELLFMISGLRNYSGWTLLCRTCCEDLGLIAPPPEPEVDEPDWLPRFNYGTHVVEPNPDGTVTTRLGTPQERSDWLSSRKELT